MFHNYLKVSKKGIADHPGYATTTGDELNVK